MKFNVNQQDLQKSLNYCQGVIEKRSTLPILSNILLVFRGEEKRLVLIQARGPVVLTGGGRSGWAPTGYFFCSKGMKKSFYLSVNFILLLNQFINAEINKETIR